MKVSNAYTSPNFSKDLIPVDFIVLHYTACDLQRTMRIFGDPARGVCAHFVLDVDGTVYDLGGFLNGPVVRGAHAGESKLEIEGETFTALNKVSIGIEIVNLNGNLRPYTEAQYQTLNELLKHLTDRFPNTKLPGHITGHEQIAGFRGKCDPGRQFDWKRVLAGLGLPLRPEHTQFVCTQDDLDFARDFMRNNPNPDEETWSLLSSGLEKRIKDRQTS